MYDRAMFLGLLVLLFFFSTTPSMALNGTLPGCQDKCGNLTIPYPFGIFDGCHLPGFVIRCNVDDTTDSPEPQPFLGAHGNIKVINISDDVVSIQSVIAAGNNRAESFHISLKNRQNPYTLSQTRNLFTAIGCDTLAVFFDPSKRKRSITGCVSMCQDMSSITSGNCSGNGCCQNSIPMGLKRFGAVLYKLSDVINKNGTFYYPPTTIHTDSKAFLVDKDQFMFQPSYIQSFNWTYVPVALDWAIGQQTCKEAIISSNYACRDNTACIDSTNGPGYRCRCLDGYRGNPYLPGGCQDVDECASPSSNDCVMNCHNFQGSYNCSCPHGYVGDGRKNGKGCTKLSQDKSQLFGVVLGCGLGFLFLILVSGWFLYWGVRKRKMIMLREKYFEQNGGLLMQQQLKSHEGAAESTARIFTEDELKRATDNFSENRILGEGTFGKVFKGILPPDNRLVAIKQSKAMDNKINHMDQFINEVVILSQVIHKNVVKILGCCLETPVPSLVYEYVPGGTLYRHLHEEHGSLPWSTRLKIAAETAGALAYLHSATERPILHRDVKSSNILLDNKNMAKVADFGASRLIPKNTDRVTTRIMGTDGYLDPEYNNTHVLTEKSDVYSFGVVLVELLTGKKPIIDEGYDMISNVVMDFLMKVKTDTLVDILEQRVSDEGNHDQLNGVAAVAVKCLEVKGKERPTMKTVASDLERLIG